MRIYRQYSSPSACHGLCLFCCYQPSSVICSRVDFRFFCFIDFPIFVVACFFILFVCFEFQIIRFVISTFTPIFFIDISFVLLMGCGAAKATDRALFVLLLSTLVCYQPNIVDFLVFFFFKIFIFSPPPPPPPQGSV